jgi:hypothetical protein
MSDSSKELLYVFGVLLLALTLISSFGGGLRYEEPFLGTPMPAPTPAPAHPALKEKYGSPENMIAIANKQAAEKFAEDARDNVSYGQPKPSGPALPTEEKENEKEQDGENELEQFYAPPLNELFTVGAPATASKEQPPAPAFHVEPFEGCMQCGL